MSLVGRVPKLIPFYADEYPDEPHRWYIEDQQTMTVAFNLPERPVEERQQQAADALAIIAVLNAAASLTAEQAKSEGFAAAVASVAGAT